MIVRRLLLPFFYFIFILQVVTAQSQNGPTEGSVAPSIRVKGSLGNNYQPNSFKDKFIVLDFWATWCAPCIAGFPHFNALADKFSNNKDIVFATITDETRQKADLFFRRTKKELRGFRLLDDSSATMNAFNVKYIPLTVVIDKQGIVKWTGKTSELRESTLDSITKKIYAAKNDKVTAAVQPYVDPAAKKFINKAAFSILLMKSTDSTKESNATGSSSTMGDDYRGISYFRIPLLDFLGILTKKNKTARFLINDKQKADFKIDVIFEPGKLSDSMYLNRYIPGKPNTNMLIHLLSKTFKFSFSQQTRNIKGFRLITTDTAKFHEFESMQTSHSSDSDPVDNMVEIVNYSMDNITGLLEEYLKFPIKNETGSSKRYDISISIKDIAEANKQLAKYGLTLIETVNEPFEVVYLDFR